MSKKILRACDQCRCRKIKCKSINGEPCPNCVSKGVECKWILPVGKRGPKPKTPFNLISEPVETIEFNPTGPHHEVAVKKHELAAKSKNKSNLTLSIAHHPKYLNSTPSNCYGFDELTEELETNTNSSMTITPVEMSPKSTCFPIEVDDKHIINYFISCTDFGVKGVLDKHKLTCLWEETPSLTASFLFFSIASYSLINGALDSIQGSYEPGPIHTPFVQKIIGYYHTQAKELGNLITPFYQDDLYTLGLDLLNFVDNCCHYPN